MTPREIRELFTGRLNFYVNRSVAMEQVAHLARSEGWEGGNLLPTRAEWAAVHEEFTDFDELPAECVYNSRERAQQELDSWREPGRIVCRLLTEWQDAPR